MVVTAKLYHVLKFQAITFSPPYLSESISIIVVIWHNSIFYIFNTPEAETMWTGHPMTRTMRMSPQTEKMLTRHFWCLHEKYKFPLLQNKVLICVLYFFFPESANIFLQWVTFSLEAQSTAQLAIEPNQVSSMDILKLYQACMYMY